MARTIRPAEANHAHRLGGIHRPRYRVFCDFVSYVAARDAQHSGRFSLQPIRLCHCSLNEALLERGEQFAKVDARWQSSQPIAHLNRLRCTCCRTADFRGEFLSNDFLLCRRSGTTRFPETYGSCGTLWSGRTSWGTVAAMGSNILFVGSGTVTRGGTHLGWGTTRTLVYGDRLAILRECPAVKAYAPGSDSSSQ